MAKSFSPPIGFRFGATRAGIKAASDKRDLALIVSDVPCAAAGVFTVNKLCAAPVTWGAARLPALGPQVIVANSGNANALTGPAGLADERAVAGAIAVALGVSPDDVLTSSTGAIGARLPVDKIRAAVPALLASLGDDVAAAAEAIRTTDLRTKQCFRELEVGGHTVRLAAIAKGSGMIHPQMATMLCFVTTDAAIAPVTLQAALVAATDETFNTITVDGDMSTNDTVIALANGRSGAPAIEHGSPAFAAFSAALTEVLGELARAVASDGEGAT
jgi:acetylglutamate kinase